MTMTTTNALSIAALGALLTLPAPGTSQTHAAEPSAPLPALPTASFDHASPESPTALSHRIPRPAWAPGDTADALYRQGRHLMTSGEYRRAAGTFGRIVDEHPDSEYAADALYWQAFNLYRVEGDTDALREALAALQRQASAYPRATTRTNGEAAALEARIRGRLAARGDEESARQVRDAAMEQSCGEEDVEMRGAALNALVELGPEEALPILRDVVRTDRGCNAALRVRVPYLLARLESEGAVDLLIQLASSPNERTDAIRKSAVRYLGETGDPEAIQLLTALARGGPEELRATALYALTRAEDPAAASVVWEIAADETAPPSLRATAIRYIGDDEEPGEALGLLRRLFDTAPELRGTVLYAASEVESEQAMEWLLSVATDRSTDEDTRKTALYTAGRRRDDGLEAFLGVYDQLESVSLKKSFIYGLSERDAPEAVDFLIGLARNEADPELKKSAIYWLGRTGDPRAAVALREIIGAGG